MNDGSDEASRAVADAHQSEWAFVLAATVRVAGDIDLAEECVQDAYVSALDAWRRSGVPHNPAAWLTTTARNRALDAHRRNAVLRRKLPQLVDRTDEAAVVMRIEDDIDTIEDDRLRLVFTCCHPALGREAQVALTLRLICGLSTAEIAQAFLVSEPTMAARVTRAKKKISIARIPYRVPEFAELPDRLDAVLTVVHLLFTTGHTAPVGRASRARRFGSAGHLAGSDAACADAGRARGLRIAGPHSADGCATRHSSRCRWPAPSARRTRPIAMEP